MHDLSTIEKYSTLGIMTDVPKQHIPDQEPLVLRFENAVVEVRENEVVKNSNQGKVVHGTEQNTGLPVVIKISHPFTVGKKEDPAPDDHVHIQREIHIMPQLRGVDGVPQFIGAKHVIQGAIERYFLVETMIDGIDFEERRKKDPTRRLTTEEAIDMIRQAATVLRVAHKKNIMHRDLKLSNFMIHEESGKISIVDWGTAKEVNEQHDGITGSTPEDSVIGTVQFMSFEQITGKVMDQRTDIYTLGAVVALLRYGPSISQRYIVNDQGDVVERPKKQIAKAVAARETLKYNLMLPPDTDEEGRLQMVIKEMTHPDRERRLQTMDDVLRLLKE
jgi:serine/threonine protein kinase